MPVKEVIAVSRLPKPTPIDEQCFCGSAQMLKALIPYVSPGAAKPLAIMAKILELQSMLHFLQTSNTLKSCGISSKNMSTEELLNHIKAYCSESGAKMIDQMLNAMKMSRMYEQFKDMENNPEIARLLKVVSGSPETSSPQSPGGESMKSDDVLKNVPKDVLNNFNPELLKSFDVNKFNQIMQAMNQAPKPGSADAKNEEQRLKAMLTPEQLSLFENIKNSIGK